jgi:hypothetical protein
VAACAANPSTIVKIRMNDAVDCALEKDRFPQSGALMAWDTMAVLMAGHESAEKDASLVDISDLCQREFEKNEMPDPHCFGSVFQTKS